MENLNFTFQLDEFMLFCRSRQLREKTMISYEQSLRLFERWCFEQLKIDKVDAVTTSSILPHYLFVQINPLTTKC